MLAQRLNTNECFLINSEHGNSFEMRNSNDFLYSHIVTAQIRFLNSLNNKSVKSDVLDYKRLDNACNDKKKQTFF